MNIAGRDRSLQNQPIFSQPSFHGVEETRHLICSAWCGIHGVAFPTPAQMILPHHTLIFLSQTRITCLGSQPAYLSEKNRAASPGHTLSSEDDNPLSGNISNNCLESRCQISDFTCSHLSLPHPFPARILSWVPWPWSCLAPPRHQDLVGAMAWPTNSILSHHQKTGTMEILAWGNFVSLAKKKPEKNKPKRFANHWGKPGSGECSVSALVAFVSIR